MKITRGTIYALCGLKYLSYHGIGRKITGTEIADVFNVSGAHMRSVMHSLAKINLISTERGHKGGFRLKVSAESIALLDIIEAVEGPIFPDGCLLRSGPCPTSGGCKLCAHLKNMHKPIESILQEFKVSDLPDDVIPNLHSGKN